MSGSSKSTATLQSFLDKQKSLITEASLTLPHQFSSCAYSKGHIRQNVYLCKTCNIPAGLCASCSVACHTNHEQVELFAKRNFRCDCPTGVFGDACRCTLIKEPKEINTKNVYGKNFEGQGDFCRCGRDYDAHKERETMVQCLVCEDWFHESCLNLRERPPPIPSIPPSPSQSSLHQPSSQPASSQPNTDGGYDTDDSISDPTLPKALLPGSAYDCLVCRDCVLKVPLLMKYAGSKGCMMVIQQPGQDNWEIIGKDEEEEVDVDVSEVNPGEKRKGANLSNGPSESKRARLETDCEAPPPNSIAQEILSRYAAGSKEAEEDDEAIVHGLGDIFFSEGWRERWCHCPECSKDLAKHKYFTEVEEVWEPEDDPDAAKSFEELGLRALGNLPREKAIDGIVAYNKLRDELKEYLRPFAEQGKEVGENDIKGFFEKKEDEARRARDL